MLVAVSGHNFYLIPWFVTAALICLVLSSIYGDTGYAFDTNHTNDMNHDKKD